MKLNDSDNYLIHGDNLAVLKDAGPALENRVRCIYIDPPYNNMEKYEYYDDTEDNEKWMHDIVYTITLLYPLLKDNGSIWVSIDDKELHHLKVSLDNALGRDKFVTTIIWNHRKTRENRSVFSNNHEYLIVYAKDPTIFSKTRNDVALTQTVLNRYKNPDGDPRGSWQSVSANVQAGHATKGQFYDLVSPHGRRHSPPSGRCWIYTENKMKAEIRKGNIWFGKNGLGAPRIKKFLNGATRGLTPNTLWTADEVKTTRDAKKHILQLFPDQPPFDTPKPEHLLYRVLSIATDPGDLVLDAYLGSGTTAASAHKMGRRYIGIDSSKRAFELAGQRLQRVIEGESGGISKDVDWTGGGEFTSCEWK